MQRRNGEIIHDVRQNCMMKFNQKSVFLNFVMTYCLIYVFSVIRCKNISRSKFCADYKFTNSRIVSLPKLKLLKKKQIDILDG